MFKNNTTKKKRITLKKKLTNKQINPVAIEHYKNICPSNDNFFNIKFQLG